MAGPPTRARRGRSGRARFLTLLLWSVGPLFEIGGLFMIYAGMPDVVDDVAFGRVGTQVVAGSALAVTAVGTAAAWRGVSGPARMIVATALFVAAGLTATLGIAFAFAGWLAVFTLLMAHATLSIVMIGRALLDPSTMDGG